MDTQLHVSSSFWVRVGEFVPVSNKEYFNKPYGGLWTSTYRPETHDSEWVEWCRDEAFGNVNSLAWHVLTPKADARIYTVNTLDDLHKLCHTYRLACEYEYLTCLDFETMSREYDGIHLTSNGQVETRLSYPENLYGWDVESTLWFHWCFERVDVLKGSAL